MFPSVEERRQLQQPGYSVSGGRVVVFMSSYSQELDSQLPVSEAPKFHNKKVDLSDAHQVQPLTVAWFEVG